MAEPSIALQRPVYIYALVDPRTDEVKYVGLSLNPTRRLTAHIWASTHDREKNSWKSRWICALSREGLLPTLRILEQTTKTASPEREIWWIAHLRKIGAKLTNLSDGGDGYAGHRPRPEAIQKQSGKLRGRRYTDKHRANIAAAKKKPNPKITCEQCGKIFYVRFYRAETARFCSVGCRQEYENSVRQSFENRFWGYVDQSGGEDACWPWVGPHHKQTGRGQVSIGHRPAMPLKRGAGAHCIAWYLTFGAVPDGLNVLRRCSTIDCCNPHHLWTGTRKESAAYNQKQGWISKGKDHAAAIRHGKEKIANYLLTARTATTSPAPP